MKWRTFCRIKNASSRDRMGPNFFLWGAPGTLWKNLNPNGCVMAKGLSCSNAHHVAKSKTHLPTAGLGQIFGGGAWHCDHNYDLKKSITLIGQSQAIVIKVLSNIISVVCVFAAEKLGQSLRSPISPSNAINCCLPLLSPSPILWTRCSVSCAALS